nr:hypothetical protein CFP56_24593 [Quercus suber]
MILDQIAWVDCIVFLIFLLPQLLINVRFPELLLHERCFTPSQQRTPFVRDATLFQDVVIRCVRFAFAKIPASIGKVFFSKRVALPFMRFRMLRHGIFKSPVYWREVNRVRLLQHVHSPHKG